MRKFALLFVLSILQKTVYILNAKSQRREDAKFKFFMGLYFCIFAFNIVDYLMLYPALPAEEM